MGLLDDARMVAAEFEYSANDVNKGVKEFIRQMDEGLQETGKSMSQIPTYVTAVPNGTEKVRLVNHPAHRLGAEIAW
ncbi:glucokinase [Xanthoria calcicola]